MQGQRLLEPGDRDPALHTRGTPLALATSQATPPATCAAEAPRPAPPPAPWPRHLEQAASGERRPSPRRSSRRPRRPGARRPPSAGNAPGACRSRGGRLVLEESRREGQHGVAVTADVVEPSQHPLVRRDRWRCRAEPPAAPGRSAARSSAHERLLDALGPGVDEPTVDEGHEAQPVGVASAIERSSLARDRSRVAWTRSRGRSRTRARLPRREVRGVPRWHDPRTGGVASPQVRPGR